MTLGPAVVGILAACVALALFAALVTCSTTFDRLLRGIGCQHSEAMREFLEESARALESRRPR